MQTKLVTKLGQRLVLTPKLTQSLKVLAMNSMELDTYIQECIQTNPMIDAETEELVPASPEDDIIPKPDFDWRQQGDDRWETMYAQVNRDSDYSMEAQLPAVQDLGQSLHVQVDCQPMTAIQRRIAHSIIDSLDDDGYFRADVTELGAQIRINPEQVLSVLEDIVQKLDPSGVGSRALEECLLLQLDGTDEADSLARQLLLHFPDHLHETDGALAELAEVGVDAVLAARARMRRLDPYPGHGIFGRPDIYIRPEVIFHDRPGEGFQVEVPAYQWAGIRLNTQWQGRGWHDADKDFMNNAMREAKWLMGALEQRAVTLYKVANCLAKRQGPFLKYGPLGLRPLTLKEVATEVGLHESTISRVTSGKYAQTPLGLIEMKCFFSAGLPTRGGGAISVFRVQQRIKALIDSEPWNRPITDQAIAARLQAEGIEIARRTVAKYREQLRFPPSSRRRRSTLK